MTFEKILGIDFRLKIVNIKGEEINLQLWDTAGQEIYKSIILGPLKSADGVVIVFDINDEETFTNASSYWLDMVNQHGNKNIIKYLIGNKNDIDKRKVSTETAKGIASKGGMTYLELSAHQDKNIESTIELLAQDLLKNINDDSQNLGRISLDDPNVQNVYSCNNMIRKIL